MLHVFASTLLNYALKLTLKNGKHNYIVLKPAEKHFTKTY